MMLVSPVVCSVLCWTLSSAPLRLVPRAKEEKRSAEFVCLGFLTDFALNQDILKMHFCLESSFISSL